jgi:multidrug resistance efflux pump
MIDLTPTDQTAPAAEPIVKRHRKRVNLAKWRARLLVVAMLAGATAGGLQLAKTKQAESALLDIGTVTLTAQAVPVEPSKSGVVTTVLVHAQQHVEAGQELGTMTVPSTDVDGKAIQTQMMVLSPTAGVVSDTPIAIGTSLQSGQPFLVLYDPAALTLVSDVPLTDLPKLAPGMVATLHARGLAKPVRAVVQRVVPRVGAGDVTVSPDRLQLVLKPSKPTDVSGLVPGLQFTGSVDTASKKPGTSGGSIYVGH